MRQGQQNRRGRGRGNRKNQNPLARSFESNGPDVKIRGTPAHVAEKYISLARDALSASDPVLAENYLQHAEHYNRIIMTYREQQVQQSGEAQNGGGRQPQPNSQPTSDSTNGHSAETNGEDGAAVSSDEGAVDAGAAEPVAPRSEQQSSRGNGRQRRSRSSGNGEARKTNQRGRRREQQASASGDGFSGEEGHPEFLRRPVRRSRRTAADEGGQDQPNVEAAAKAHDDASAE